MKLNYLLVLFVVFSFTGKKTDLPDIDLFVSPKNRQELITKMQWLPLGVKESDSTKIILQKISKYLNAYQPKSEFEDDAYAKISVLQALKSVKTGGYGIGAVIYEKKTGKVLHASHNKQLHKNRSDLHGEMSLMNEFENNPKFKRYRDRYIYKEGLIIMSSAEPCPMCFIRLATVGVDTKFCTIGPDDGMTSRVDCLPAFWRDLAKKHEFVKAKSSKELQLLAHIMFFSFLLDGRHV